MSERSLYPPLLDALRRRRWVRDDTWLAEEVPVHGRSVDIALLTATGSTTSYEVKLSDTRRALEQAAYNQHAFDRSYVVVACAPGDELLRLAERLGVGIFLVDEAERVELIVRARRNSRFPAVRQRVVERIRSTGTRAALQDV